MGLFDIFKHKEIKPAGKKASPAGLDAVFAFEQGMRTNLSYDIKDSKQAIEAYYAISYIGFCASLRARAVGRTDFVITDKEGNEIKGLKVEALLRRPIESLRSLTRSRYYTMIDSHLLLDGNAFIWKAKDNASALLNNKPSALIPLNPATVQIYDDKGIPVKATSNYVGYKIGYYRVTWVGGDMILPPEEVIHINYGSPVNLLRGMGIVQQNGSLLEADKIQDMFNKAFFERGAIANILISQKDDSILPKDFMEAMTQFKNQYGVKKDPIMVVPPGTEAKELNLNYDNLQFIDLRKLSKENVLMMFRIPRSMAAMENQYVAKDEDKIAWEDVLEDDYCPIEDSMTDFIRDYEERDDIHYKFKRANTIASKNKAEVGGMLVDRGSMSPYDYHLSVTGKADDSLSKETYLPFNYMPVSSINNPPEVTPAKSVCNHGHKAISNYQRRQHTINVKLMTKSEESILKISKEYFKGLEQRVLKDVKAFDDVWNDGFEGEELLKNAKRLFTSAIAISLNGLNEFYGSNVSTEYSRIKLVVEKLSTQYVSNTLNKRKEDVRTIIETALNGSGPAEIKNSIQEAFGKEFTGANAWKAQRIARTESNNAHNQASKEVFSSLGVQVVDVVGCEDDIIMPGEQYGCNSVNIPVDVMDSITFHPNHIGSFVIQEANR
jgi:HK97 family phage portal protein